MKKFLLVFIILLVSCDKPKEHNEHKEQIDFTFSNNLPIIKATLNGVPVKILIDTGASVSLLDTSSSDNLFFTVDYDDPVSTGTGLGGIENIFNVRNTVLVVGKDTLDIKFKGVNLKYFRRQSGVVGIIGSDYLRKHDLIINYENMTLKK